MAESDYFNLGPKYGLHAMYWSEVPDEQKNVWSIKLMEAFPYFEKQFITQQKVGILKHDGHQEAPGDWTVLKFNGEYIYLSHPRELCKMMWGAKDADGKPAEYTEIFRERLSADGHLKIINPTMRDLFMVAFKEIVDKAKEALDSSSFEVITADQVPPSEVKTYPTRGSGPPPPRPA